MVSSVEKRYEDDEIKIKKLDKKDRGNNNK